MKKKESWQFWFGLAVVFLIIVIMAILRSQGEITGQEMYFYLLLLAGLFVAYLWIVELLTDNDSTEIISEEMSMKENTNYKP